MEKLELYRGRGVKFFFKKVPLQDSNLPTEPRTVKIVSPNF